MADDNADALLNHALMNNKLKEAQLNKEESGAMIKAKVLVET